MYPENNHTIINFSALDSTFTEYTYLWLLESLQFCFSSQIMPLVISTCINDQHKVRLMSPYNSYGTPRLPPPLLFQPPFSKNQVWDIFKRYFEYIKNYSENHWHPISVQHQDALESSAASFNAEALGLAVATEGLAKICYSNSNDNFDAISTDIDKALSLIRSSDIDAILIKRIEGSLNAMKGTRNSDIIRRYVAEHGMSQEIFWAWHKLRNIFAHGKNNPEFSTEELLKLKDKTTFLFYSMILNIISYTGERTNYSADGWPAVSGI
jgi:hypothetical protein